MKYINDKVSPHNVPIILSRASLPGRLAFFCELLALGLSRGLSDLERPDTTVVHERVGGHSQRYNWTAQEDGHHEW